MSELLMKEKQNRNIIKQFKKSIKTSVLKQPVLTIVCFSLIPLLVFFIFWDILILKEIFFQPTSSKFLIQSVIAPMLKELRDSSVSLSIAYFTLVATIALGIITLRLTLKTEHTNRMEKLQELSIKKITFYNQYETFLPSKMKYNNNCARQFLMKIDFDNFNNHYAIEINNIQWGRCDSNYCFKDGKTLNNYDSYVENGNQRSLYIFFNDFEQKDVEGKKESVNYFYYINEYVPETMNRYDRYRWICLNFSIKEKINMGDRISEEYQVAYHIMVENVKQNKDCVELHEIQHNMNIKYI